MSERKRLDQYLVERNYLPSRSRARDAVLRGTVRINGLTVTRPGMAVAATDRVEIDDEAARYVSRAALKLKSGLEATGFEAKGRAALDIGASTGGFTQVLVEAGATHVHAVDVGHGQISPEIAQDPRVTVHEGVNARDLASDMFGDPITCIVCDVSFISLRLALPPALDLAAPGAWGLFLVKPQFELGKAALSRQGTVRDENQAESCAREMASWLDKQSGWRHVHLGPCPIRGGDGNREFMLGGVKEG